MAKLYFYYSAMNAGKSTTLLQSSYNYQERGMNTILFIPEIDTRFQKGYISSRIGLQAKAIPFSRSYNLYQAVERELLQKKIQCVLVDEAQFLTKEQVFQLSEIADKCNIPVLTYGLRSDFRGEPFEGSQYLLAWAEEIVEIKTICHCGKKAIMNMRVDDRGRMLKEGEQIHIGGNESYVATCRLHFKQGNSGLNAVLSKRTLEESINE